MANGGFALTLAQQDIYFDQLRRSRRPLYNVGGYIRLGAIDVDRMREAHRRLVAEHDVFGLRIVTSDANVRQAISEIRTSSLPVLDFSASAEPQTEARRWADALFQQPLPLEDAELFRAYLVKLSADEYWYVGLSHHVAMDGWGFANWAQILSRFYDGRPDASSVAVEWREIALEDANYLASEKYVRDRAYWIEHLQRLPERLLSPRYLGADHDVPEPRSSRRFLPIAPDALDGLKSLAASADVSLAHVLLAMLACYFSTGGERDALVFGLPFHNRRNRAQKRMLGVFTGISPLRLQLDSGRTFGELLRDVAGMQRASLRHQRYPIGHIVRDLGFRGEDGPLYDIGFNYLQLGSKLEFQGTDASLVYLSHRDEATPLMVTAWESRGGSSLELQLDYNHAYFSARDIEQLSDRFRVLLQRLPNAAHERIADIELLPDAEVQRLLARSATAMSRPPTRRCIHHFFEEQVRRVPDDVAVVCGGTTLTYRQLNAKANQLAHRLAAHGARAEVLVGVCMERTVDLIVSVLGVLKAGGAYVPLDSSYPRERIGLLIGDSAVRLVLTEPHLLDKIATPGVEPLFVPELLEDGAEDPGNLDSAQRGLTPDSLAYVIYTSGSTGTPKGVEICHRNTVALIEWASATYSADELARVLVSTSLNFDLSIFEIFAPLSGGHRCVLVRDALALATEPVDVTLINTVPSAIKTLIEARAVPASTRVVNLCGEALPMQIVNDLLTKCSCRKVYNLYGPSEDTTYSTAALFTAPLSEPPSIGRAIGDKRLYVLTSKGKLAPDGAVGELYVGGSGVARGYLRRPPLTAERFVSTAFAPNAAERLYRTGDLVRWRENGELDFLGRGDDQVKIRGFRVELGEIRWHLERLDQVKAAAVLARPTPSGETRLVAFVVRVHSDEPNGLAFEHTWVGELRSTLEERLPRHMVPAAFVVLDELPLTSNGKLDKSRLAAMDCWTTDAEYVAPATPTEIRLAALWSELLGAGRERVSAAATFFGCGGHSLLAMKLAGKIREEWCVSLPLSALFGNPTLQSLAGSIDAQRTLRLVQERLSVAQIVSEGSL